MIDLPVCPDPPNAVVLSIGDEDVALRIRGDSTRLTKGGKGCLTGITGIAIDSIAGEGGDETGREGDAPEVAVEKVGHDHVAVNITAKGDDLLEGGVGGWPAIARKSTRSGAREGGNGVAAASTTRRSNRDRKRGRG